MWSCTLTVSLFPSQVSYSGHLSGKSLISIMIILAFLVWSSWNNCCFFLLMVIKTTLVYGDSENYCFPKLRCVLHSTMLLSPCKIGNREFESHYHHRPHFLAIQLFQRKYLGYTLDAVSLSLHIFVGQVGLLQYTRSFYSYSLEDFDLLWLFLIWKQTLLGTSWSCFQKQATEIFEFIKIEGKYLDISNYIFTMKGASKIFFYS